MRTSDEHHDRLICAAAIGAGLIERWVPLIAEPLPPSLAAFMTRLAAVEIVTAGQPPPPAATAPDGTLAEAA